MSARRPSRRSLRSSFNRFGPIPNLRIGPVNLLPREDTGIRRFFINSDKDRPSDPDPRAGRILGNEFLDEAFPKVLDECRNKGAHDSPGGARDPRRLHQNARWIPRQSRRDQGIITCETGSCDEIGTHDRYDNRSPVGRRHVIRIGISSHRLPPGPYIHRRSRICRLELAGDAFR